MHIYIYISYYTNKFFSKYLNKREFKSTSNTDLNLMSIKCHKIKYMYLIYISSTKFNLNITLVSFCWESSDKSIIYTFGRRFFLSFLQHGLVAPHNKNMNSTSNAAFKTTPHFPEFSSSFHYTQKPKIWSQYPQHNQIHIIHNLIITPYLQNFVNQNPQKWLICARTWNRLTN